MDDITLSDNQSASRYELRRAGAVAAQADYELQDGAVVLTHTEVQPAYEGQGMGSELAKFALDDIRKRGLKVVPKCDFMVSWIERHPDYADLVASS